MWLWLLIGAGIILVVVLIALWLDQWHKREEEKIEKQRRADELLQKRRNRFVRR